MKAEGRVTRPSAVLRPGRSNRPAHLFYYYHPAVLLILIITVALFRARLALLSHTLISLLFGKFGNQ